MWENVSWLDVLSFAVSLLTAAVAFRLDHRQQAYLKDIRRREKDIAARLEDRT